MAVKVLDDAGARVLIGANHLVEVFWIQLSGETGRVFQVTKHDRQLTAFGRRRLWHPWRRCSQGMCHLGRIAPVRPLRPRRVRTRLLLVPLRRHDRYGDRHHEAIAVAVERLNDALLLPIIAHGLAHSPYGTLQRRVTDALLRPHLLTQLLLVHDALTVRQQVQEHLKHLWPQVPRLPRTPQGNTLGIKLAIVKGIDHDTYPTAEGNRALVRPGIYQRDGTGLAQRTLA